ncbi:MAG: transposase [Chloroflexi bacterium]|nr:transposase [Chloroflexota bacterium]
MSLQWDLPRQIPAETAQLGQALLGPEHVYRQLGERFDELFPDESAFGALYEVTGRGAISPLLLALVTVFQMLEQTPDRVAADWVVSRLDWKYALHLPLSYAGFHYRDRCAFRKRLLAHRQERLAFEPVLKRLKELGLIKCRAKGSSRNNFLTW